MFTAPVQNTVSDGVRTPSRRAPAANSGLIVEPGRVERLEGAVVQTA